MSSPTILPWVASRILAFFNSAQNVADLLDGTIQDDPSDGQGRTIGPGLAARILRTREQLPRRRFTTFAELDSVPGVGEGTIQDLVYSFGTPAAAAFQTSMYDNNVIYRENWPLLFVSTTIEDKDEFDALVHDEGAFRAWVIAKIQAICTEKEVAEAACTEMQVQVSSSYIDTYSNNTQTASLALALWFYKFDADNWFSWERILQETTKYFEYHIEDYPWYMELRFFKGFVDKGILQRGITPPDLPVVLNEPEQTITLWFSTLYD